MHASMYICSCKYIYIYTHLCIYIQIQIQWHVQSHIHLRIRVRLRIPADTCIYACTYIDITTCMHIYIYKCTHVCVHLPAFGLLVGLGRCPAYHLLCLSRCQPRSRITPERPPLRRRRVPLRLGGSAVQGGTEQSRVRKCQYLNERNI